MQAKKSEKTRDIEEYDNFAIRQEQDRIKHEGICQVCRNNLDPGDSSLWAVKNRVTREFIHVIADTGEEAAEKLGWVPEDVKYTMGIILQTTKKKMSVETKQHLKDLNKQRRETKKQVNQDREKRLQVGVLDKTVSLCLNGKDKTENLKRKEGTDMTLNNWVKEFIDGHVMVQDNGKATMDPKALFVLAEVNALDVKKYKAKYKSQDAGRIKMTVGNMLRGAASRRHKLLTPGGKSTLVPSKFVKGDPVEDVHGKRIGKSP